VTELKLYFGYNAGNCV